MLGSPIISSARIYRKMEDGSLLPFNIQVQQTPTSSYKVESVHLNDIPLNNFMTHSSMATPNSHLTFVMQ